MPEGKSGGATSSKSRRKDASEYGRGEDPQNRSGRERNVRRRSQGSEEQSQGFYGYDLNRTLSEVGPQAVPAIIGASAGVLLGLFLGGRHHSLRSGSDGGWLLRGRAGGTDASSGLETDETAELIASSKVEGTPVYSRDGEKLGHIHNFMVGKRSGRVAYAVLSFGGMLGVGGSYYPLPWEQLTYDTSQGGYVVDLDKDRINEAPSFGSTEDPFSDPAFGQRVTEYWSAG